MAEKDKSHQKMKPEHVIWVALYARGEHFSLPKQDLLVMEKNRHVGYNKKTRMYEPTPRGYRDAVVQAGILGLDPQGIVQLILDIPDEHLDVFMPYHKIIPNPIPIAKLRLG